MLSLDSPTVVLYVGASLKLTDTSSVRACGLLRVLIFVRSFRCFTACGLKGSVLLHMPAVQCIIIQDSVLLELCGR